MPKYKNELTHQIITTAFQRYSSTRNRPYVQLQMLYKTLCQMASDNSGSKKHMVFDRDIFEEVIEESLLVKEGDHVMVQMQSFRVNVMRAQILLNQALKNLRLQITNIVNELSINNRFQLSKDNRKSYQRLSEIKQQREQSQNSLFCLRLTFIKQEDLKLLTQKLLVSDSQLNYSIKEGLREFRLHEQNRLKNSSQLVNTANNSSYFKPIFVLTLVLIIPQSLSMIFYSNFTLSILLFGIIMSIYINQKYTKIMLRLLLLLSLLSIVMDLGFIYVHFRDVFNHNMSNVIENRVVVKLNEFCAGYFVTGLTGAVFTTFFGKILLSIFLLMQLIQKAPNTKKLSLLGNQIQLRFIATLQQDTISQSLAKSFF